MQCKDIPDQPILDYLATLPGLGGTWFEGFDNSVQNAMPPNVPSKLARAKMASLIRRGLVEGCACGCRGDFRNAG
jgi:hypothetical protein